MNLIRCDGCLTEVDPELTATLTAPMIRLFGDRDELHLCRSCWLDAVAWVAERRSVFTEPKETA